MRFKLTIDININAEFLPLVVAITEIVTALLGN